MWDGPGPFTFFSENKYLLGDSAFSFSDIVVPAYKCSAGCYLDLSASAFNDLLVQPRVKLEHYIGILKGRFPWLKIIRIRVDGAASMKKVCEYVQSCVILHNVMLSAPYDSTWIDEEFSSLADDDSLQSVFNPEVDRSISNRRDQILFYLSEVQGTNIYLCK